MNPNRRNLLETAAVLALAGTPSAAYAQTSAPVTPIAAPTEANQEPSDIQPAEERGEIIVTGSRVGLQGFQAPTPTRVLTAEALEERALSNVGEILNEVPSFRPTQTPSTNTQSALGGG